MDNNDIDDFLCLYGVLWRHINQFYFIVIEFYFISIFACSGRQWEARLGYICNFFLFSMGYVVANRAFSH